MIVMLSPISKKKRLTTIIACNKDRLMVIFGLN
jgi:hypothetical protein